MITQFVFVNHVPQHNSWCGSVDILFIFTIKFIISLQRVAERNMDDLNLTDSPTFVLCI